MQLQCNCNATAVFPMSPISQWVACCSYPDMRCRNTGRGTGWGRQSPMPGWRRQSRGAARHRETTRIEAAQSLSQSMKKGHAKVTCKELWSTCHKSTFPNLVFMRNIHIHTLMGFSLSLRLLRVLNFFAFSGKSVLHGTSACRWSRLVHSCSRSKKSSAFIRFAVPSCENSTACGHQSFWDKAQSSNNNDLVQKHHRVQRSPTESNGVQHLSTRFIAFANLEDSRRFSKILVVLVWIAMIRFFGSWLFPSACICMLNMFTHVSLPHVVLYTSVTTVADSCEWHRKCALGSHRVSVPGMCSGGTLRATFDPFQSFHSDWIWACQQHS